MEKACVFCDRSQFEERLIAETNDFWIIATLGQITDGGYTLLVPKRHVLCIGASTGPEVGPLVSASGKVAAALAAEYGSTGMFFEHGIVGQTIKHAHLHFLPEDLFITPRVINDFLESETVAIGSWSELCSLYERREEPYLLWGDAYTPTKVCWNPPAPLQYFRTVAAEALGRPERANWRTMDPELDRRLWSETVTRLKPYFR